MMLSVAGHVPANPVCDGSDGQCVGGSVSTLMCRKSQRQTMVSTEAVAWLKPTSWSESSASVHEPDRADKLTLAEDMFALLAQCLLLEGTETAAWRAQLSSSRDPPDVQQRLREVVAQPKKLERVLEPTCLVAGGEYWNGKLAALESGSDPTGLGMLGDLEYELRNQGSFRMVFLVQTAHASSVRAGTSQPASGAPSAATDRRVDVEVEESK